MSIKGFNVNGVTEQYDYNSLDNKPEIHNVPTGGTAGQVLAKTSGADYAVGWVNQTGGGGSGEEELFYCTYGTTIYSDIQAAIASGKIPVAVRNDVTYYVYKTSGSAYLFFSYQATSNNMYWVRCDASGWTNGAYLLQERLRFDSSPTQGSQNPVTSDGIYQAIQSGGGSGGTPYDLNPAMDGTASAGSSNDYARGDHVHPKDTAKVDKAQGVENAGKLLVINSSGNVVPGEMNYQQIQTAVDDWLDDHAASIDGLSFAAKQAIMDCFAHVAWVDANGQQYYDALYNALFEGVTLDSITAVFTQGSAVIYDTDSLDTLKQYLTVTATYSDSTTETVTGYTLSGTLTEGTSAITVSYGGKTDSFNVTVIMSLPSGYTKYDYISPIVENSVGKISNANIIFLPLTGDKQQMKYHFSYKVAGALGNVRGMLGGRNVSGTTEALGFYAPVEDTFFRIMACGATDLDFFTLTSGIVHDVTYIGGNTPTVSVDGNGPATVPVQSVPVITASLGLFGNQVNHTGDTYSSNNLQVGRIRIYSLADALLADYVPCVEQSTGNVGVYDKVSEQFIGKASTRYATGNWS